MATIAIAVGTLFALVVASPAGAVPSDAPAGWGRNAEAQVGTGSNSPSSMSTPSLNSMAGSLSGQAVRQVATSQDFSCAITVSGAPACWGTNVSGQLGNGTNSRSDTPVAVNRSGVLSGRTAIDIVAGVAFACVLTSDGRVFCWGNGGSGQLGWGSSAGSSVPVAVDLSMLGAGESIARIGAGGYHMCAITTIGRLYCWGNNDEGQLGDGTYRTNRLVPTAVDTSGVLRGQEVLQVNATEYVTCAVTAAGIVACWGFGTDGLLGIPSPPRRQLVPIAVDTTGVLAGKVAVEVAVGANQVCARSTDGTVACWGQNSSGQLGNGTFASSEVPVAVDRTGVLAGRMPNSIASGVYTVCVTTTDGGAACWGAPDFGALGTPSVVTRTNLPVAVLAPPGGRSYTRVVGRRYTFLALTAGPAPTVTSTDPSELPIEGSIEVVVTGTGFALWAPVTVTIGGMPCTDVVVQSATTLRCTAGAHQAGVVDVVVTNPDGPSGTGIGLVSYVAPPPPAPPEPEPVPIPSTSVPTTGPAPELVPVFTG